MAAELVPETNQRFGEAEIRDEAASLCVHAHLLTTGLKAATSS